MSFNGTKITDSRIISMAETFQPHEIAAKLRIEEDDVLDALQRAGRLRTNWIIQCRKTGRWWRSRTARGAYQNAQLRGLTDWDWWPVTLAPPRNQ